ERDAVDLGHVRRRGSRLRRQRQRERLGHGRNLHRAGRKNRRDRPALASRARRQRRGLDLYQRACEFAMKTLPAGMQAALARGATTFCHCWLLVRKDGARLGFTDHDRDISFDGDTFEAAAGFAASAMEASAGMASSNLEVSGGLNSERLSAADLAAGLYDDAEV